MNTVEIEITPDMHSLNRSKTILLRTESDDILSARITGNEEAGDVLTFRDQESGVTSNGKITAVAMPVTGSIWVTLQANGNFLQ